MIIINKTKNHKSSLVAMQTIFKPLFILYTKIQSNNIIYGWVWNTPKPYKVYFIWSKSPFDYPLSSEDYIWACGTMYIYLSILLRINDVMNDQNYLITVSQMQRVFLLQTIYFIWCCKFWNSFCCFTVEQKPLFFIVLNKKAFKLYA